MPRIALAAVCLTGCASSYTSLTYDVSRSSAGVAAPMVAGGTQPSGAVAVGFGGQAATMEVVLRGQDLEMAADPWMAASAGLELKLRPLRVGPVRGFVHGGPVRAALFDRDTLAINWGAGLGYGAGITVGKHGFHLVVDAGAQEIWFAGMEGGPPMSCSLRTLSVGLQLGM